MTDQGASDSEDRTICFCHNVPLSKLIETIRAGATSLGEIQDLTRASTGCGGCECDVLEVLEAELARARALEAKSRVG
jgi:nitrite reductase (NADH) large subunit